MKKSRFTEQQIINILKQADAGVKVQDLCRQHGISDATYYKWKSKYGGMEASDIKRLREVEAENSKLKRMFADTALENRALKETHGRGLLCARLGSGGEPWTRVKIGQIRESGARQQKKLGCSVSLP